MRARDIETATPSPDGVSLGLVANYKTADPQAFPQVSTPKSNVIHMFVHRTLWSNGVALPRSPQRGHGSGRVTQLASPGCVLAFRPAVRSMASHPATGRNALPQDDDGPDAA